MNTVFNSKNLDTRNQPLFLGEPLSLQRFDQLKYPKFFKLAEKQEESFWRANEISLLKDRADHKLLSDNEKFIFDNNLRWQTMVDSMLSRSIDGIAQYVSNPELEAAMKVWSFFESNIHSRSYSHILKNIYSNESDFWNSIIENPEIMKRAEDTRKYYDDLFKDDNKDLKTKIFNCIVSTNVVESLSFYISFACSFFFGVQGKMEGNAKIIKLILKDEACCDKETEIITSKGWKYLSELSEEDLVGQVHADGSLNFVKPNNIIKKKYVGKMKKFSSKENLVDMSLTPDHRMVYKKNGEWREVLAEKFKRGDYKKIISSARVSGSIKELSMRERLLIAIQADGSIEDTILRNGRYIVCNIVTFRLRRERKKERLEWILQELNLDYTKSSTDTIDEYSYYIKVPVDYKITKKFDDWVTIDDKDYTWCREFVEELVQWDGHIYHDNRYYYSSVIEENVNIARTISCLAGYKTNKYIQVDDRKESYKDVHRLSIIKDNSGVDSQCIKKSEVDYDDYVYCVSVDTGMFLAKRNSSIFVTGNCHVAVSTEVLKIFRDVEEEGFQEVYDEEKIKEAFITAVNIEKDWSDYLFQHGNLLGLTKDQFKNFAEFKANERLKILGIHSPYHKYHYNPLGNWYDEFTSRKKTQVAPQESELEDYAIGARNTEISEDAFSSFEL